MPVRGRSTIIKAIMPDDLRELRLPDGWQPAARFGARNSVFYAAEEIMADRKNTALRGTGGSGPAGGFSSGHRKSRGNVKS